jgi:membrane protease YdiL (CAAX protease family)
MFLDSDLILHAIQDPNESNSSENGSCRFHYRGVVATRRHLIDARQVRNAMKPLNWRDSILGLGLAIAGAAVLYSILFFYPIVGSPNYSWAFNWAGHAWFVAIPLIWYFRFDKRFPVGKMADKMTTQWAPVWILLVAIAVLADVFGSQKRSLAGVSSLALIMNLLFYTVLVGISEEFMFRGQIQTGLNNSIEKILRVGRLNVRLGTVLAALIFAAFHSRDILAVPFAFSFGIVVGHYYQKTGNLWGAVIIHNLVDLLGSLIPLLLPL